MIDSLNETIDSGFRTALLSTRITFEVINDYQIYQKGGQEQVGTVLALRKRFITVYDPYLLGVSTYIHNNQVKAGIVEKPEEYQWSSYNEYVGKTVNSHELLDTVKILASFSNTVPTCQVLSIFTLPSAFNITLLLSDTDKYKYFSKVCSQ